MRRAGITPKTNEEYLYNYIFYSNDKENYPRWRGNKIIKYPTDLILYEQAIYENQPDVIIETGTAYGGSAIFFADMLALTGKGKVITIDRAPMATPEHPGVFYITGRATATDTLETVYNLIEGKVMVVLDSDHRFKHVQRELFYYSKLVTPGQFLVVEDCYLGTTKKPPAMAIDGFMAGNRDFEHTDYDKQFGAAVTRYGWLKRK